MGILGAFRNLGRVLTGEVIRQIDTPANGGLTTMSLRLKKARNSSEYYIVLACLSSGNYQYSSFSKDEFVQFAEAAQVIRNSLMQGDA